jgi:hypothetical protein
LISADARHYLHWNVVVCQGANLFIDRAVEGCIAVMKSDDPFPALLSVNEKRDHSLQGHRAGSDLFASVGGKFGDPRADE